jgi:hypothetical protein
MDFITNLPSSKAFDSIFVVVDRLIKMVHFMPYNKTVTSEETTRLFIDIIYKHHGLFDNILFNRGSQFTSKYWQSLFKIFKVEIKFPSAYHPQTGGLIKSWSNICIVPSTTIKTRIVTTCRVFVQQHHPRIYSLDSILCQLQVPSKV